MYSLPAFGKMIADSIRTPAYVEALRRAVKPGSVVLDIGTGTGIFALIACQLGASRVYAIEPSDAIEVAREIAAVNGYAHQIEFIQGLSTQVTLPEPADVIISDLRGMLPLFESHIPSIIDARRRFLASGGILIPQQDVLWATVVEAPQLYSDYDAPWNQALYGLQLAAARKRTINTWGRGSKEIGTDCFLTAPQAWATLDYQTIENPDIRANLTWTAARAGTAHGLSLWFEATLAPEICYSTAPGNPKLVYGNAFFPWEFPVSLLPGDKISVTLQADLVGDDYIWRWNARVLAFDNPAQVKANFRQSTFYSQPLSLEQLRKRAETYFPTLNEAGKVDAFILEKMAGGDSVGAIAQKLTAAFPNRFPTYQKALVQVRALSERYS
jgi:protein arginine N-methyltransferase 1